MPISSPTKQRRDTTSSNSLSPLETAQVLASVGSVTLNQPDNAYPIQQQLLQQQLLMLLQLIHLFLVMKILQEDLLLQVRQR